MSTVRNFYGEKMSNKIYVVDWFNYECHYNTKKFFLDKYTPQIDGKPKYWIEKTFGGEIVAFTLVNEKRSKPTRAKNTYGFAKDWGMSQQIGYEDDYHDPSVELENESVDYAFREPSNRSFMNSGEEDDYNHLLGISDDFYPKKLFSPTITEEEAIDRIFNKVIRETPNLEAYSNKDELMDGFTNALFRLARKTNRISNGTVEKLACLLIKIRKLSE